MFKKITLGFVFLAAALLSTVPVHSQSANLIEAGKKEGKAVVYGSLESDSAETVFNVFKKKTGIEVDYLARVGDQSHGPRIERISCGKTAL